jgi:hypothetical protein
MTTVRGINIDALGETHKLCRLGALAFGRSTTAVDRVTGATVLAGKPRYELLDGKESLFMDNRTNNLLASDNIANCTDTLGDTTGFNSNNGAVLSSSTDYFKQGSKSLKVVTSGSVVNEGFYISQTMTTSTNYIYGGWVKAPLGATLQITIGSTVTSFTGTGSYQFVWVKKTSTGSENIYIYTSGTAQAITFYVDMLQFEAPDYSNYIPTSWNPPSAGWRYTEQVSISTQSLVQTMLNIDTVGKFNLDSANQSRGGDELGNTTGFSSWNSATITYQTTEKYEGTGSIQVTTPGNAVNEGVKLTSPTVNDHQTYWRQGYIKGTAGVVITAAIYNSTYDITLTGGWQYFEFSGYGKYNDYTPTYFYTKNQEATTFYVDKLQLEYSDKTHSWIKGQTGDIATALTIEGRFYLTQQMKDATTCELGIIVFRKSSGSYQSVYFNIANGNIKLNIFGADVQYKTITGAAISSLSVGWHRYAITADSSAVKLYIDDSLSGTPISNPILWNVIDAIWIGNEANGNSFFICSNMCEFVTSNTVRTAQDLVTRGQSTDVIADTNVTGIAMLNRDLEMLRVVAR